MSETDRRAWLKEWIYSSTMFRVAYLALFITTAIFCGATSLALLNNYGIKYLVWGMLLFHSLLVIITQLVLRIHVLRAKSLPYPPEKYRFFGWVVARNALVHIGVYMFFAFLSNPVFRPNPSGGDYQAALAFLLLGVMAAVFVALRGRSTLDAAHHR